MSAGFATHADWYEQGHLAPYVRSRRVGGEVLTMMEAGQPAGDMSDPPTNDLVLTVAVSDGIHQKSDMGGGVFEERSRAGTLFLIPPGVATQIEVHNDHVIRCLAFPSDHFGPMLGDARGSTPFDFGTLHRGGFKSRPIVNLTNRLWEQAGMEGGATRLFTEGLALAVLGELTALADQHIIPLPTTARDWRLRRAIEFLEARIAEDVGLADVAAEVDLSPRYLRELFHRGTGLAPHGWLMRCRINRACELLMEPGRSITDIALALGFASSQHLATVFRKQIGTTPSDYRRERLT